MEPEQDTGIDQRTSKIYKLAMYRIDSTLSIISKLQCHTHLFSVSFKLAIFKIVKRKICYLKTSSRGLVQHPFQSPNIFYNYDFGTLKEKVSNATKQLLVLVWCRQKKNNFEIVWVVWNHRKRRNIAKMNDNQEIRRKNNDGIVGSYRYTTKCRYG